MKVSKLVMLGMVLLLMGLAVPTLADDSEVPAAEAPTAEPTVQPEESVAPEPAAEPAPAPEAAAAQPADESEPWAAETPSEAEPADPAIAGTEAAPAPEAASEPEAASPPAGIQLGAIGYDDQGRPGRIHVVAVGDTLWHISDAYLGTPWVWPSIWDDNRDIANPHRIYPGDHIWITPSEMRKISAEEAEALLAGEPSEEELSEPASQDLDGVTVPGAAELVETEQPRIRISDREKVGLVSTEVVDAAASILTNIEPRLMISQEDRIYIGLGAGDVADGDQFTVFRIQEKVFDPESGRVLGYHVNFLGWIEVVNVTEDSSLAMVRESASAMRRGDKLVARRAPVSEIPLGPSPDDVVGQISFLPNSRTEMGMLDYVYLNRGTLDGVEVGSPLQVYRKGFPARDEIAGRDRQIPDRVVADLVVVRSAPEASVAFVRHTEEELTKGDYFRGAAD